MAGAFQTTREIFEKSIWQNIVEFRLFFLIYGMAAFKDDVKIGNITLKRGQWIRSYRNLQDDLQYIENRSIKKYSLSTISRTIDKLVKDERLKIEETELGTLFEVLNYNEYQCLDNYKNIIENAERTEREQQQNSNETPTKHRRNNNKNAKKEKKAKKDEEIYSEMIFAYTQNIKLIKALNGYIEMRANKKKEPTAYALELVFKDLDKFSAGDDEIKIAILEKSIINKWTGIFELKTDNTDHKTKSQKTIENLKRWAEDE